MVFVRTTDGSEFAIRYANRRIRVAPDWREFEERIADFLLERIPDQIEVRLQLVESPTRSKRKASRKQDVEDSPTPPPEGEDS